MQEVPYIFTSVLIQLIPLSSPLLDFIGLEKASPFRRCRRPRLDDLHFKVTLNYYCSVVLSSLFLSARIKKKKQLFKVVLAFG